MTGLYVTQTRSMQPRINTIDVKKKIYYNLQDKETTRSPVRTRTSSVKASWTAGFEPARAEPT